MVVNPLCEVVATTKFYEFTGADDVTGAKMAESE